ncbi:MAG TPA: hypothetical protein VK537_10485 [Galbitalea sp.]|nr:hypothetical protein [Galbitalea sp.]
MRHCDLSWDVEGRIIVEGFLLVSSGTPHEATLRPESLNFGDACGVSPREVSHLRDEVSAPD